MQVIKMYAIFARETLTKMKYEGKLAAQSGHCFLHAWWDAEARLARTIDPESKESVYSEYYWNVMNPYKNNRDARKITLVVDTVAELEELYEMFRPHMGATLVEDCGYTVFDQPTVTGVGLGPIPSDWTNGTRLADLESLKNEIH